MKRKNINTTTNPKTIFTITHILPNPKLNKNKTIGFFSPKTPYLPIKVIV
ncbi:MAG: hypothetical protein QXL69_06645 [Candidatus Bathyarchaeia archaeon]